MSNYRKSNYEERVIRVSRVSTKTKGGDQMSFSVLMVVGDRKGKVGVGLGKAKDVVSSIRKGVRRAKKNMIEVPIKGTTVPFKMVGKHGAGQVLLKPASKGSGVIAGGPVRAVMEAAGIKDISAKILGSDNQASSVHATFDALKKMQRIIKVRGIDIEQEKEKEETPKKKKPKSKQKKTKKSKSKKPAEKKAAKSKKSKEKEKTAKKKTSKKKSAKKSETKKSTKEKKSEEKIKKSSKKKSSKKKESKAKKKETPKKKSKKKKEKKTTKKKTSKKKKGSKKK